MNRAEHSPARRLPPTTDALLNDNERPYFLWWTDATVGRFKEHLASSDPEERAYRMGALLREANTRDVWLFVTADEIPCCLAVSDPLLGHSRDRLAKSRQVMRKSFDRRVISDLVLDLVRACIVETLER